MSRNEKERDDEESHIFVCVNNYFFMLEWLTFLSYILQIMFKLPLFLFNFILLF